METMLETIAAKGAGGGGLTANGVAAPTLKAAAAGQLRHQRSFEDCEKVLQQAALADPKPTHIERGAQASALLGGELVAVQEDEDEVAQVRGDGGVDLGVGFWHFWGCGLGFGGWLGFGVWGLVRGWLHFLMLGGWAVIHRLKPCRHPPPTPTSNPHPHPQPPSPTTTNPTQPNPSRRW